MARIHQMAAAHVQEGGSAGAYNTVRRKIFANRFQKGGQK